MLPILFQSPELILYSYPLLMGLGWGIGYQVFFAKIPENYPRWQAQLLFWGCFVFAWIGAKFLFLLTIPNNLFLGLLTESTFWTGGGFVFYGGLLGGLFFLFLFRYIFKLRLDAQIFWPIIPALSLGHGIGRIGCLLAGCCFGEVTDAWWGVYLHGAHRHPTQLLEAMGLLALGIYSLKRKKAASSLASDYLLGYGFLRFGVELLRGDEIRGEWGVLTPSQWISLGLILAGLILKFRKSNYLQIK